MTRPAKLAPLGVQDIPIQSREDETLGNTEYAQALTEFIVRCQTPMTIAIQGDWGSGKTSLMKLIEIELATGELSRDTGLIRTLWFNTWQYSQFDLAGQLPILLIDHFIDELSRGSSEIVSQARKLLKTFKKIGTAAAGVGLAAATGGTVELDKARLDADPVSVLRSLKSELEKLVQKRCDRDKVHRIVVFIDDLDRVAPVKAIEILEVMKVFMDVPGCVFVLACDYDVVKRGLKDKFKVEESELQDRSFFDKIVQLPFNMPKARYNVRQFLATHLDWVNDQEFRPIDLQQCDDLIRRSIGTNPRNIKRLINSLILLDIVLASKLQKEFRSTHDFQLAYLRKILLGVKCMEAKYPNLFSFLMQSPIDSEMLANILTSPERIRTDPMLTHALFGYELGKDRTKEAAETANIRRLTDFMKLFVDALRSEPHVGLTDEDISSLRLVMGLSAITSVGSDESQMFMDEIDKLLRQGNFAEVTQELDGFF